MKRRYREKLESVGVTQEDTFLWRNESDEYAWQRDSVEDIMHTSDTVILVHDTALPDTIVPVLMQYHKFRENIIRVQLMRW